MAATGTGAGATFRCGTAGAAFGKVGAGRAGTAACGAGATDAGGGSNGGGVGTATARISVIPCWRDAVRGPCWRDAVRDDDA